MIQARQSYYSSHGVDGDEEVFSFGNKLDLGSRKPDFQAPLKKTDQSEIFDECFFDDEREEEDNSKSTDAFIDHVKRSKQELSSDMSLLQIELKNSSRFQNECSLWFDYIDKEVYVPLRNPRVRPDSISKDAINPEEVRYFIKQNQLKGLELLEFIKNWSIIDNHDDTRVSHAYTKGGLAAPESMTKKYRNIAKDLIGLVGKKIFSGNFNLSTVSFPIKAMVGESVLEKYSCAASMYPLYMNLAMKTTDPLQRFKFVVTASVSYLCFLEMFAKPLNPILGETFQGYFNDGAGVFLEQISHHPPISYMLVTGPRSSYSAYGPYTCSPSAGLNSLTINSTGWKKVVFHDTKQEILITNANDEYEGTFFGKCLYRLQGSIEFVDKENKISCKIVIGKSKKKMNDYFAGDIKVLGKTVSKVTGTYLGWLEIDGYRYFDHRYVPPFEFHIEKSQLESDSYKRSDILLLREGDVEKAQKEKERLEMLQRADKKLRETHEKSTKKRHNKSTKDH